VETLHAVQAGSKRLKEKKEKGGWEKRKSMNKSKSKKAVWEGAWPNPQTAFLKKNSLEFNGFYKPMQEPSQTSVLHQCVQALSLHAILSPICPTRQ
jgi:hypothetical protein